MQYALWFFCPAQVIGRRAKIVLVEGGGSGAAAVLGPGIRPCPDPARIFNIFHFIKIFSFTLWIISRTKAMKQQHPVAQQQILEWEAKKDWDLYSPVAVLTNKPFLLAAASKFVYHFMLRMKQEAFMTWHGTLERRAGKVFLKVEDLFPKVLWQLFLSW